MFYLKSRNGWQVSRICWGLSLLLSQLVGCAAPQPESAFARSGQRPEGPVLLAHRGVSQTFDPTGVGNDTCTATRIDPPTHPHLENTLSSLEAAFAAGADIAEIDVHPTTDGDFVVFHDWTLDCRSNGRGRTRDHSLAELKALDIGYGYTADGGKTFPFRGKGVGLMPSLAEVLAHFPEQMLVINIKSDDPAEGELLVSHLARLTPQRRRLLAVYGGERPISIVRAQLPEVLAMSRKSLMNCLTGSLALGWSGFVPASCERTLVLVPLNYTQSFAGWPEGFIARMQAVGSAVFVAGPYSGGASTGIDSLEQLNALPPNYRGGIWTNQIELLGQALKSRGQP